MIAFGALDYMVKLKTDISSFYDIKWDHFMFVMD